MDAVARLFSATWDQGRDPLGAYVSIAGKRIAVDIAALKRRGVAGSDVPSGAAKPGLRFDRVATRLIRRLQTSLDDGVPDGMTVLVTVTAPIRLASKTAAAREAKIPTLLGRKSPGRDVHDTIHGHHVRIRLLSDEPQGAPKFIGFVHNADSDHLFLLNTTGELLELLRAEASRRVAKAGDRWLVVLSARGISWLEAYRYIYSELRIAPPFKKILMAFGDGRVGVLTG